jgi:hypothetical protein
MTGTIKPNHKALAAYYETLRAYGEQQVTHEGALETAFQRLLADTARARGWMLVPKQSMKRGGKMVIPDGTLRDEFNLVHGYWEAKDTDDDLTAEIRKKTARGYPLNNTIFEDTERAVLFQNGQSAFEADLRDPRQLADLLNAFYAHSEPDIEGFEEAVGEFKERVPELALALAEKIKQAHRDNAKFQTAFADFLALCRAALNPNLSEAAVDEMLVQHLLTERLIRKIFDNPEFTRRNVIAAEVEKVIAALVSKSFNRDEFLKSLDRFSVADESEAARVSHYGRGFACALRATKGRCLLRFAGNFDFSLLRSQSSSDVLWSIYTPQHGRQPAMVGTSRPIYGEFGKAGSS